MAFSQMQQLLKLAKNIIYNKSVAQVVFRWEIQCRIVVIPKSVHADRMKQNFEVFNFQLTDEDMNDIACLDQLKSSFFYHQDPSIVEWFMEICGEKKKDKNKINNKQLYKINLSLTFKYFIYCEL